jgi:hypothetical protein
MTDLCFESNIEKKHGTFSINKNFFTDLQAPVPRKTVFV